MNISPLFAAVSLLYCALAAAAAPPPAGTLIWGYTNGTASTRSGIGSSPALAPDGTIYIATPTGLQAITNNGSVASNKWTAPVAGCPVVGPDGTVYTVSWDGLNAIGPDGLLRWTLPPGTSSRIATPGIGYDGTIYYAAGGKLYAASQSGVKKWEALLDAPSDAYVQWPVITGDSAIVVGLGRTLYAFDRGGSNKWSASLYGLSWDSPALGRQGPIYSSAGPLYAFTPDGQLIWSSQFPDFAGSPVLGTDGTVYAATVGRALYAVAPGGQTLWSALNTVNPQYGAFTAPAIDLGGRIYYCVSNSLWALSPQGQVLWKFTTHEEPVPTPDFDLADKSPIIGPGGTIYSAIGGALFAIATGTNGPASSPWPMYRQNARHSGKVEKPALKEPQKRSDANFEFQLYSQLGQTNTVEGTTDLSNWTMLTSLVVTSVPMDVVDLAASNYPARFYRASAPP